MFIITKFFLFFFIRFNIMLQLRKPFSKMLYQFEKNMKIWSLCSNVVTVMILLQLMASLVKIIRSNNFTLNITHTTNTINFMNIKNSNSFRKCMKHHMYQKEVFIWLVLACHINKSMNRIIPYQLTYCHWYLKEFKKVH